MLQKPAGILYTRMAGIGDPAILRIGSKRLNQVTSTSSCEFFAGLFYHHAETFRMCQLVVHGARNYSSSAASSCLLRCSDPLLTAGEKDRKLLP